jgi:hypothetical protein
MVNKFYESVDKEGFYNPYLQGIGFLLVKKRFALILGIKGGMVMFCDPFTL